MQRQNGRTLFSAADLVAFLECEHATTLALHDLETPLARAADDESLELIQAKRFGHEAGYLSSLKEQGLRFAAREVPVRRYALTRLTLAAIAAMAVGCGGPISHPASNLDTTPTNDQPNPSRSVSPWGNLPADHSKWCALNGVAIDKGGKHVRTDR